LYEAKIYETYFGIWLVLAETGLNYRDCSHVGILRNEREINHHMNQKQFVACVWFVLAETGLNYRDYG
jgi:hypothetical protein